MCFKKINLHFLKVFAHFIQNSENIGARVQSDTLNSYLVIVAIKPTAVPRALPSLVVLATYSNVSTAACRQHTMLHETLK